MVDGQVEAVAPVGDENLKEVLAAAQDLVLAIIPLVKDGVQLSDAVSLGARIAADPVLKAELEKFPAAIGKVGAEIKDLSFAEGIDLAKMEFEYLPKFIAAIKG